MKKLLFLCLIVLSFICDAKTLGLLKDARSAITDGLLQTMKNDGWEIVIIGKDDLKKPEKLAPLDVIFLPNGWNEYYYVDFDGRKCLTDFVASGKGILAGGFRSGYCRSATRPLFPEVGVSYNRVNGVLVTGSGKSELAKAVDAPFFCGGWDHMVIKTGPKGNVFAVCADDPVGVYGEVFGGRYIALGLPIGISADKKPLEGTSKNVLLKCLEWLNAAPKLNDSQKAKNIEEAELSFYKREASWDWTLFERGPDNGAGVIPQASAKCFIVLESRLYMLQNMSRYVGGDKLAGLNTKIAELSKDLEILNSNYKRISEAKLAELKKMNLTEIKNEIALFSKERKNLSDKIREELFPSQKLNEIKENIDKFYDSLRPDMKAVKNKAEIAEHKEDLKKIPQLLKSLDSKDINERRDAVSELGRIGAPETAGKLISLLDDKDEKLRTDALIALGWMQSKEAVPALIKILDGSDLNMKRRAAQALGLIGDQKAIAPLMKLLIVEKEEFSKEYPNGMEQNGKDFFTAENAIDSLGLLKAKEAVPQLIKIAENFSGKGASEAQMNLGTLAVVALGYIGDPAALPVLEKIAAEQKVSMIGRPPKPLPSIYSCQWYQYKFLADRALALIKEGGRKELGAKQPDFLNTYKRFYALKKNFNAFLGRSVSWYANYDYYEIPAFAWKGGFTGIHNAWGMAMGDMFVNSDDVYLKVMDIAGDFDLVWVDVMPANSSYLCESIIKSTLETDFEAFRNSPAWTGTWYEEEYPNVYKNADFDKWLDKKYGKDYKKKLGLASDYQPPFIGKEAHSLADFSGPLLTEYMEFCADVVMEYWRESQDWMKQRRKGASFTHSVTHRQIATYPGLTGKTGEAVDAPGPESYQSFGRDNAFIMEMFKNGEDRPVMCEFYNWYGKDSAHDIRGFAQHLMHGECFFNFHYQQISKFPMYYLWVWDSTRWNDASSIFQKAAKVKEYIAVPKSAANIALLCSGTSAALFHKENKSANKMNSLGARWYQQQAALWTALSQNQMSVDVIWNESSSLEKLNRYSVIVLSDAKIMTEEQVKVLREWVKNGGVLIASGTDSLFTKLPAVQKNYMLADVFGLDYAGFAGVKDAANLDTYSFSMKGDVEHVKSSMELPSVRDHVLREVKPVKSLDKYIVQASAYLPGIADNTPCEYDMPLGYDKVKVKSAEVLAKFKNGDPALTLNKFGKGLCYFWTPIYPGLSYIASDYEMDANKKDFWPNVRELLAAMVKGGLNYEKKTLPVEISGVSKEIELTLRQQPDKNRMMVHLLNYDSNLKLVKSPKMIVNIPEGKSVKKIFYPDTDTDVKFTVKDGKAEAVLRDFEVHDMAVVQF